MNSTNWPSPNVWVGLHGSVGRERCSANAETMGSNPVEVPKFWGVICNCLNCNYHCDENLDFRSSDHLQKEHSNVNRHVRQC